jgi:GNAT superfamily N-acetyltransferase
MSAAGDEAPFRIVHADTLLNTEALALAVRGWSQLLDAYQIDLGACAVAWDHKAIICVAGPDNPIGVLTYTKQDWANQFVIVLAYVKPPHRRQGIHTAMFNALVRRAEEQKISVILSGSSIRNMVSRAAQRSQGRIESGVITRFKVLDPLQASAPSNGDRP